MTTALETSHETATRMPGRWRDAKAVTSLDFGGGFAANLLHAVPGEVFSAPSAAHILGFTLDGARRHRQWRGSRLTHDGPLPRRAVNLIAAGDAPRAVMGEANRILHLYVPSALVASIAADQGLQSETGTLQLFDPAFSPDGALVGLAEQAVEAMCGETAVDRLWRESLALAICVRLLQRWSNVAGVPARSAPPLQASDWRLRRAIEYLDAKLGDDVGLAMVAAAVNLTTSHLTSLFRAGTGEPPHRWLMRRRFERACEMLADPRHSITGVAHACGFASSQHLATVFRKRLGVTPGAYRRARQS